MPAEKRKVSLGILGAAEVAGSLVIDVLNDHFALGAEDSEGYFAPSDRYDLHLSVPAGKHTTSQGVHRFWEWGIRCELPYQALWDETTSPLAEDVLSNVVDAEQDILIVKDAHAAMIAHLVQAENPMLLLLSTDGQFDEATADAAAQALREGIPVHDLSRALLEVTWQHLPGHEAPPEEAEEDAEPSGLTAVPDGPDVTLSASEAAVINSALEEAEGFLVELSDAVVSRTEALRGALVQGRSLLAPSKPAEPEPEEAEKAKKTRLVIFNPDTGAWEPAGRGRPPKNARTKRVPA